MRHNRLCYHGPDCAHSARLSAGASRAHRRRRVRARNRRRRWPAGSALADALTLFSSSWKDRLAAGRASPARGSSTSGCRCGCSTSPGTGSSWPPVERFSRPDRRRALVAPAADAGPRRAAQVVTIYDLDFLDHPERTRGGDPPRLPARWRAVHARRADAVVTISRYTAGEIAARLGVPADRIVICSPGRAGLDAARRAGAARSDPVHRHARAAQERRRAARRLRAAAAAGCRRAPPLWLAGGVTEASAPWLRAIARTAARRACRPHLGYVAGEARYGLYRAASMLVLPSHMEGFGMPVLEAMTARRAGDRRRARRAAGGRGRRRVNWSSPTTSRGSRRRCGATSTIPRRRRRPARRGLRARGTVFLGRERANAASTPTRRVLAALTPWPTSAHHRHRRARAARRADRRRPLSRRARCAAGRRAATRRRGGWSSIRPEALPFLRTVPDTADVREVVAGSGRGTWWEQTHLRRAVRANPPDVFFAAAYTAPLALGVPLAVTIHDVSFVAHPEWFRPREGARRRLLTRQAARAARRRLHRLGVLARRDPGAAVGRRRIAIRVIPPGVTRRAGRASAVREPLVLFVGLDLQPAPAADADHRVRRRHRDPPGRPAGDRRRQSQLPARSTSRGSPRKRASASASRSSST